MGRKERRQQEKEIRRNDIIDAAERVFFSKGYENSSMDEVAKEADFSKRTVYVYFSSKEQLYYEIMIRGYRLLIDRMEKISRENPPQNAPDELHRIFLAFLRFSQEYPAYFNAIMEYETKDSDARADVANESAAECYRLGEQVFGCLFHALQKGVAEGSLRRGIDAEKTALFLWACAVGIFNTARKKGDYLKNYHRIAPGDFVTESFDLLMRLIGKNGGSPYEPSEKKKGG